MGTIFKRDFLAYFRTPVGYAFMGVFLTLAGLIFYLSNLQSLSGDLLSFLAQLTSLCMLLCPLLTMRLLCEERQKRTDQLTLTAPVSLFKTVLGKYLAAAAVVLMTVAFANVFTLIIALYGTVYPGEWFVGFLGFTLQSLSFLALDLFVSCFAKNQMTGAVAGFGANFFLWMADLLAGKVGVPWLEKALNFVSLYDRYEPFLLGQFSYSSVLFFLTFIIVCLVAAVRVLDARRFSEGGAA
ncbi:MAG: ABC transporter permease subunit [Eubacteriales bacterium]|nr:ABC transporter permease subunit [Eubacteriales bacterium]